MPVTKHKRKTVVQLKNKSSKRRAKHSVIEKYPRTFFYFGASLIAVGIFLLLIGAHNNAKVGLAMLSIFIGGAAVMLANSALPKKTGQ